MLHLDLFDQNAETTPNLHNQLQDANSARHLAASWMDVVTTIEALPVGRFHRLHLLRQMCAWSVFAMSRMRSLLSTASPSACAVAELPLPNPP